tara:strand:- start:310 stop:1032 length:723 start_codon:yes stop_codon:yes gene_type:complete
MADSTKAGLVFDQAGFRSYINAFLLYSTNKIMKETISRAIHHRYFNYLSSAVLVTLYLNFIFNHVTAIREGGISPAVLIFLAMETTVVVLLILRGNPQKRATTFLPWFFALAGTFLPLALSPNGTTSNPLAGDVLVLLGGSLAIAAYLSLNTSHGTTPALRKVKTKGMYAFIRHPMYFSYIVLFVGYLNLSMSPINLAIILTTTFCLTQRIYFEEQILKHSPEYVAYMKEVKYRLIPFVY